MKILDLTGKRFGRLVALRRNGRRGSFAAWDCLCDCGTKRTLTSRALIGGHNKSCGCFRREFTTAKNTKHGLAGTTEFRSWASLRQRCTNPNDEKYPTYGGRGITFCERWNSFANFFSDMGKKPSLTHTIHRKNNDLGYYPENCTWATPLEQGRNKTNSVMLTLKGCTRCASEWADVLKIGSGMIRHRLRRGWTHERALLTPARITK